MQSCFLCFDICLLKTHKNVTRHSRCSYRRCSQLTMTTSNYIVYSQASLPIQQKLKGRGNKIVVETVVKSKIGELEEEVRAGDSIRMRKNLTVVVQGILRRRRFFLRFQNRWKNNLSLNQLTVVIVEKIPEDKKPDVSEIAEILEDQVELEKG